MSNKSVPCLKGRDNRPAPCEPAPPPSTASAEPAARSRLAALRQAIRGIEGRFLEADAAAGLSPLGHAEIDRALGGGLPRALHEIAAASEAAVPTATLFALALVARAAPADAVLWIVEDMALLESGVPYGPGIDEIGLRPERVVTVAVPRARDVLQAMEEGLRSRVLGAVIGELRQDDAIDAVAGRRLSLAAHQHQRLTLLLRAKPDARPLPAMTRWVVTPTPSLRSPAREGRERQPLSTGPPTFSASLVRNRCGRTGSWVLEWNRVEQCLRPATTHPQPVAEASVDGPRQKALG